LLDFCTVLGTSIQDFRRQYNSNHILPSSENNTAAANIEFRLLITCYPQEEDDSSDSLLRHEVAQRAALPVDHVVFANMKKKGTAPAFQRASAINVLHNLTRHSKDSVLAIVDVDMHIGPQFLVQALTRVRHSTIYFPIVWSEQFRPATVLLVETLLGRRGPLPKYSIHRGMWREHGYGMYAISGGDAQRLQMDEKQFVSWGGEDRDFYQRCTSGSNMTIVRKKEYGLTHVWHSKDCDPKDFAKRLFYKKWYVLHCLQVVR
jgi:hypothetical protein